MRFPRWLVTSTAAALIAGAALAGTAHATFPYPTAPANPGDYSQYRVGNQTPSDLDGKREWMYSATPAVDLLDPLVAVNNLLPWELGGVRGAHIADAQDGVNTAWERTTGRPDVAIAVLDSGIKWNDAGAMTDVRLKTRISKGEAKVPNKLRGGTPLEPLPASAPTCNDFAADYDANKDGVFNVSDYACDDRVELAPAKGVGPAGMLDPQDVLIAFTDGVDDDGNGFKDDMVGWDFLDDDNDPYDDVQYGHGTGESRDSSAEADNGGDLGACPNCMVIHMRVGDSFVADVNRFAQATIYAVDNDVLVVQEALGTLNNSRLARQAVDYAYNHGVTVIASAADEAAQHNNWPSSLPHVILVNSVTKWSDDPPVIPASRSYLEFTGCTNFNAKITVAIPSVSCSSDATGRAAGMAGLIYSAALNAREANPARLQAHPTCKRVGGSACAITANEVRQLMATGRVNGQTQVDDVDFAQDPEPSCSPAPSPTCTDPFLGAPPIRPAFSPLVTTRSYPARGGPDQFYGYGRVNMFRATDYADAGTIVPEVEITSPEWFEQVDPRQSSAQLRGTVYARGQSYTCEVYVAPGAYPNTGKTTDSPPGDYKKVSSSECNGTKAHTGQLNGLLANLDLNDLKSRFPGTAGSFDGREPGTGAQTASGRPNTAPYGFYVKVIATAGGLEGEDRRQLFLHRDKDMLSSFPRELRTDGASSPLFVDLTGDNRNELVFGTSDGFVHAIGRDAKDLPGWPVRGDQPPLHSGGAAFKSGAVSTNYGGAVLAGVAAGDLGHDGAPEIVAADLEGKIYAWDGAGKRVFAKEADPKFSGKPLQPFENVRKGVSNRTQHGFLASPVLADLDRNDGGKLEIVAAGMDRHLYAWNDSGSKVDGFPVLMVDKSKVADNGIDATTHAVTFDPAKVPDPKNQGAIVDTPAVGDVAGDSKPEIILGTNEEYLVDKGTEGAFNAGPINSAAAAALTQADLLDLANGRVYAVHPDGEAHAGGNPFLPNWPTRVGLVFAELLPVVGEGVNGSPVIAPVNCPSGGDGRKIGVIPAAGLAYIFNPDSGTSCQPQQGGNDTAMQSDISDGTGLDVTRLPAVGYPAFGEIVPGQVSFLAPVAGVIRALDLAINEYQGGADGVAAWNPSTGQFLPGWPAQVNDLQFLTGPAVADIDGVPGQEVLAGSASMDLAAFGAGGLPANADWPKLSADWMVATPLVGSLGTLDTATDAHKVVVAVTRRGTLSAYDAPAGACSPGSSPRFHHDNWNSGDFERDAVAPGKPFGASFQGGKLAFKAPGDDLLCGTADAYELVHSDAPISGANFGSAAKLAGAPAPADAGAGESVAVPNGSKRYVALRARDEQGNVGRLLAIDRTLPNGGLSGGPRNPVERLPSGAGGGPTKRCLPRRVRVTARRIGPARLGRKLSSLTRRYRLRRRTRNSARFCVRGGGRFTVGLRRGRVDLIASTARGHRTRQTGPGRRVRAGRPRGSRPLTRRLRIGFRTGKGRVIYAIRRRRTRFLAVVTRGQAKKAKRLDRRLRRLGFR